MRFTDSVRGLLRRWYIIVPGLLIAALIALGAWFAIPPGYNRSATQLMIPGELSIPEGGNPYLYLGGLSPAADVLVRAIGSENVLNDVVAGRSGMEIEISRDTMTASPIILIEVTASSDSAAEAVLNTLIDRTATVLDEIQDVENIPESNRMTVIPVTVDEQSTEQQRSRLLAAAGVGAVGLVLTVLITSQVEGASRRRQEGSATATSEWAGPEVLPGSAYARATTDVAPTAETAPRGPGRPPAEPTGPDQPPDHEFVPEPRPRVRW